MLSNCFVLQDAQCSHSTSCNFRIKPRVMAMPLTHKCFSRTQTYVRKKEYFEGSLCHPGPQREEIYRVGTT
jgi:hypothetical protein